MDFRRLSSLEDRNEASTILFEDRTVEILRFESCHHIRTFEDRNLRLSIRNERARRFQWLCRENQRPESR